MMFAFSDLSNDEMQFLATTRASMSAFINAHF